MPIPEPAPSPDGAWLLLQHRPATTAADLEQEPLRLAGLLVDPATGNWAREPAARLFKNVNGFTLVRTSDGARRPIVGLPPGGMSGPLWSNDSRRFAFLHYTASGAELWVADAETGHARRLPGAMINEAAPSIRGGFAPGGFRACLWLADSLRLLCLTVPRSRPANPPPADGLAGPTISTSAGDGSRRVNYLYDTEVLRDAHDDALFRHFITAQPQIVDTRDGAREDLGAAAIYLSLVPSPDETALLARRIEGALPRSVSYFQFPHATEILDAQGTLVRRVAEPVVETSRMRGVIDAHRQPGPRDFAWRPDRPASLVYSHRLDDGSGDRLMQVEGLLFDRPHELMRVAGRINTINRFGRLGAWTDDGRALVHELAAEGAGDRVLLLDTRGAAPAVRPIAAAPFLAGSTYRPMRAPCANAAALQRSGDWIYVESTERTPGEGQRHRLSRFNLASLEQEILFRPAADRFETIIGLADGGRKLLLNTESSDLPPDVAVQNLANGRRRIITNVRDDRRYYSASQDERIELQFQRPDGERFGGDLFLPHNRPAGRALPLLVWTYPGVRAPGATEARLSIQAAAASPYRFRGLTSDADVNSWIGAITAAGYGLLFLDMPVVGGRNVNDIWVGQLTTNAVTAVDRLVELGIAEPGRIAIAGHSNGGLTAGLLLAHTDLFAAGISIDGAYDTHLFPFGWGYEQRDFWSATTSYDQLSLFRVANRIEEPFLMIHGTRDTNFLTPIEGARMMYAALYGLGRPARLVELPVESHAPVSQEAILQTLAEIVDWLDATIGAGRNAVADQPTR